MAVPELPISNKVDLAHAYDGGSKRRPRRALHPLERDVLCRILGDIFAHLRHNEGDLSCLLETPIRGFTQDEYNMLVNVYNTINPRPDGE